MTNIDVFARLRPYLQGAGFESTRPDQEHPNMMFLINSKGCILHSTVSEVKKSNHPLPVFANISLSFPQGRIGGKKITGYCKKRQAEPALALKIAIADLLTYTGLPKELQTSFEYFLEKDVITFPTKEVA